MNTEDKFYFGKSGQPARFEKEYVLWGLPKGETDRLHEKVLSTKAKTPAQMDEIKRRAAKDGWHSFRVQILDLSKPYTGFSRPGQPKRFGLEDACWEGYEPVGTKQKDGRTVPNCVPKDKNEQPEEFGVYDPAKPLFRVRIGTGTVSAQEFMEYARKFVPGVGRNDFLEDMIEKVNEALKQRGDSIRATLLMRGQDFSRPGQPDKFDASSFPGMRPPKAKYRIGAQVAVDYKGETVRGTIDSLISEYPEAYRISISGKNVRVKRLLSEITQHFPTQNWLGQPMSRPGSPDKFDASSLNRGDFAEASTSPMLGKLLAAKVMPEGGWRAVQVGSDTLVISFEDADLASDFGRRVATKGYNATSPVQAIGRYWNVEVKNGK